MAFTELSFDANGTLLKTILGEKSFIVPEYQRDYSWKKKNIEQLMMDLFQSNEKKVSHFIGSVVLFGKKTESNLEVVDGQQRLITVTLLLSVIKELCVKLEQNPKINEDEKKAVQSLKINIEFYLFRSSRSGPEQVLRVSRTSNAYLKNIIELNLQPTSTKEEKTIADNYKLILKLIQEKLDGYRSIILQISFLTDILETIEGVAIIPIYVTELSEAYTIFEVLNDRGLSLTVADLLKNLLFQQAFGDADKLIIKKTWEEIQSRLEDNKIDLSQFIRHFWLALNSFVRDKDLYDVLRMIIRKYTSEEVKNFGNQLNIYSKLYRTIYEPSLVDFNGVKDGGAIFQSLKNIREFRAKQIYPLILILYKKFNDGIITAEYLLEALDFLEKKTYLFIMADLSPSIIEGLYSDYGIAISILSLESEIKSKLEEMKIELNKKMGFLDLKKIFKGLIYDSDNNTKNKAISYTLQKIESKSDKNKIIVNFSIEHIYPKDPKKNKDGISMDTINGLGNLTLITQKENEDLDNSDDFENKKKVYSRSSIGITKDICTNNVWSKVEITARYEKLEKDFEDIFGI